MANMNITPFIKTFYAATNVNTTQNTNILGTPFSIVNKTGSTASTTNNSQTATFTAVANSPTFTYSGTPVFLIGDNVVFSTTGTLPAGLTTGIVYQISNVTATTFSVAYGAVTVTVTTTGSGTHTVAKQTRLDPEGIGYGGSTGGIVYSTAYDSTVKCTVALNATGTFSAQVYDGTNTVTILLNGGTALTANVLYEFYIPYKVGSTVNFQSGAATSTKCLVLYVDEVGVQ